MTGSANAAARITDLNSRPQHPSEKREYLGTSLFRRRARAASSKASHAYAPCFAALSLVGGGGWTALTASTASATACSNIGVVAAHGTFEPGTPGLIVGDPVNSALQRKPTENKLSSYAVNHPAGLP
ncbi:hypothetical protein [Streptomyces sp. NPDC020597]|uniref:hypothetical protein n=1 Tax=unclassified Streptomyces TaxID=2593676 RepID=UPI0037A1CF70